MLKTLFLWLCTSFRFTYQMSMRRVFQVKHENCFSIATRLATPTLTSSHRTHLKRFSILKSNHFCHVISEKVNLLYSYVYVDIECVGNWIISDTELKNLDVLSFPKPITYILVSPIPYAHICVSLPISFQFFIEAIKLFIK